MCQTLLDPARCALGLSGTHRRHQHAELTFRDRYRRLCMVRHPGDDLVESLTWDERSEACGAESLNLRSDARQLLRAVARVPKITALHGADQCADIGSEALVIDTQALLARQLGQRRGERILLT